MYGAVPKNDVQEYWRSQDARAQDVYDAAEQNTAD
jgi:hypothetical protein